MPRGAVVGNHGGLNHSLNSHAAILDAAVRAFLRVGYEPVSVETVAAEAGVSRRTVFNQFGSKEALFRAAIERLWRRLSVFATADEEVITYDVSEGLRRLGWMIADFWDQPEAVLFARLVIAEGERFGFLRDSFVEGGRNPALEALTRRFQSFHDQGRLDIPNPALAAAQFVGLVKDVLWWPTLIGDAAAPSAERKRAVIDSAVTIFTRAFDPEAWTKVRRNSTSANRPGTPSTRK